MLVCQRITALCCLIAMAVSVGCGSSDPLGRKAISGSVSLDGTPVEQGNIAFEPEGAGAATSSGANITAGKFAIEQEFGLPPGKYRVRVNIPKPGTGGTYDPQSLPGEMLAPPEELAPPEWNTKSTESIEVKPEGPFVFKFDVTSKKKK